MTKKLYLCSLGLSLVGSTNLLNQSVMAQVPQPGNVAQLLPPPQDVIPQPQPKLPIPLPEETPPPQPLTPIPPAPRSTPPPPTDLPPGSIPATITVKRFEIVGSTVKELTQEIDKITKKYSDRPISLAQLFELRSEITKLYIDAGYITSGAIIPPQELDNGVVQIQISEGSIEDIKVTGTKHLTPNYIRSRIALAATKPLNQNKIVEALQLLRLKDDQLIKNISSQLSTGAQPGESLLEVNVTQHPRWESQVTLDNGRTPSVGSFRRQIQLTNFDLLGLGDRMMMTYTNTNGSNSLDASYTIPFNPRNGKLTLSGGFSNSNVIEKPFNALDINSNFNYLELTARQPIIQNLSQEFALGLTISHRNSKASLLNGEVPFLSPGADENGKTTVTALRFFQDYTVQDKQQVFATRSQFSFGLGNSDSSNAAANSPGKNFFAWRGQAQYVRLFAEDTLLLLRSDLQLANKALLSLEQFGLGGHDSVRGYRQDQLLSNSGLFLSAEARFPILRIRDSKLVLQLTPFIDFGHAFKQGSLTDSSPSSLLSAGLGLRLNVSDRLTARLEYGIPLIQVSGNKESLQEKGIYFSLNYRL